MANREGNQEKMRTIQIQHHGNEYEMTIEEHMSRITETASLFATLWKWEEEENDWLLVSRGYHLFKSEFDTLLDVCFEHLEGVNYETLETLALENGIDLFSLEEEGMD